VRISSRPCGERLGEPGAFVGSIDPLAAPGDLSAAVDEQDRDGLRAADLERCNDICHIGVDGQRALTHRRTGDGHRHPTVNEGAHEAIAAAALRQRGHVVGFMGDGINDAAALKAADVGISVDSAVDIAKESSDIILLENSLLALQAGVPEGRRVFGNILKYVLAGLSSRY